MLQRRRGPLPRDGDAAQAQAAPAVGLFVHRARSLARMVEQLEEPGGRAGGAGGQIGEVAQLVGGDAEDAREGEEGHELAQRDPAVDHGPSAEGQHEPEADVGDELQHRAEAGVQAPEAQEAREQRLDRRGEPRPLALLQPEGKDHARRPHLVGGLGGHHAAPLLRLLGRPACARSVDQLHHDRRRQRDQREPRQLRVDEEHDDDGEPDRAGELAENADAAGQQQLDRLDVGRRARDELPRGLRPVEVERGDEQVVVERVADARPRAGGVAPEQPQRDAGDDRGEQPGSGHGQRDEAQVLGRGSLELVDRLADEPGRGDDAPRAEHRQDRPQDEVAFGSRELQDRAQVARRDRVEGAPQVGSASERSPPAKTMPRALKAAGGSAGRRARCRGRARPGRAASWGSPRCRRPSAGRRRRSRPAAPRRPAARARAAARRPEDRAVRQPVNISASRSR